MAYDVAHGQVVLFGGRTGSVYTNDTWVWDGTNWTQKSPTNSPIGRENAGMAYDAAHGQVVLFGGFDKDGNYLNDTWVWDGTNWTQKSPTNFPPGRGYTAMTYDAARSQIVLFGGYGYTDNTNTSTGFHKGPWVWDGTNWVDKTSFSSPSLVAPSLAYDAAHGQVVLFGGNSPEIGPVNQTWVWDGTNLTQKSPTNSPPARFLHAMAYDAVLGQVLLFGGLDSSRSPLNDTWVWDGTNWTQTNPESSPPARFNHAMAYDAVLGQVLLFGGQGSSGLLNDTWVWPGDSASSTGTISVTTNLSAASFTITGPANYNGGGTSFSQTNAPAGLYTIVYNAVTGYKTPVSQTLNLPVGASISFNGTYQPSLLVTPQSLVFQYAPGSGGSATPQQLSIASSAATSLPFTISFITNPPGGTWLSLSQLAGTATSTGMNVAVSVSPQMPVGSYFATAIISAPLASNPSVSVPVTLVVSTTPPGPPTPAQKATLTVGTNTNTLLNKASFTIFDAAGHPLSGAINVTSFGPTGVLPGPYSIVYNALPGYYTPLARKVSLKPGDSPSFKGIYRRLILVSFTGWNNAPNPSSCGPPNPSPGSGVQYFPDQWSQPGTGMTQLLLQVLNDPAYAALKQGAAMAAFTFYTTDGEGHYFGDACTPPSLPTDLIPISAKGDHAQAGGWMADKQPTSDDIVAVVGHSYGGNRARFFVEQLNRASIATDLLVTVDPIDWGNGVTGDDGCRIPSTLADLLVGCNQSAWRRGPSSARSVISYFQVNGAPVPFLGQSVPVEGYKMQGANLTLDGGVSHLLIDEDAKVHQTILDAISGLVRGPKTLTATIAGTPSRDASGQSYPVRVVAAPFGISTGFGKAAGVTIKSASLNGIPATSLSPSPVLGDIAAGSSSSTVTLLFPASAAAKGAAALLTVTLESSDGTSYTNSLRQVAP